MTKNLLALALAASIVLPVAAYADDAAPQRRIVVIGEGEAAVAPDMALLSLSVMREAKSAREALDANNKAMAEVIAAMKASGVADRDLQTAGVQISPRYNYTNKPDGTQEAKLAAYQVTNTFPCGCATSPRRAKSSTSRSASASTRAAASASPTTTRRQR